MIIQYDDEGRINHVMGVHHPKMAEQLASRGVQFVEVTPRPSFDPITHGYVANGKLAHRPEFRITVSKTSIIANGVDECLISGLPMPCPVLIDEQEIIVTDGYIQISSDMPATYNVTVRKWPYMDWEVEVIAS